MDLANTRRGDELAQVKTAGKLSREALFQSERQNKRNLTFQREQFDQGVSERAEERSYGRKTDVYNRALAVMAGNKSLQDRQSRFWGGR